MKGISFTEDMAAAIRDRRKTQTRRPAGFIGSTAYYKVGQKLYIKEKTRVLRLTTTPATGDCFALVEYSNGDIVNIQIPLSTYKRLQARKKKKDGAFMWVSARYMLKDFTRTYICVSYVIIQRLGEMSEKDYKSEGFDGRDAFIAKWKAIHGHYVDRDFVFVINFELYDNA